MPAVTTAKSKIAGTSGPLSAEELRRIHAWWRACNYLAVGMIYLRTIRCCASRSPSST